MLIFLVTQDFLADELQTQFERLSNQARFVKMIVDKELIVSNRKKNDLMAELRRLKFRPFPKVAKAKAAGETEDVVQPEDEDAEVEEAGLNGGSTDYDYLLGMSIWSLTKEKVCISPWFSLRFHSECSLDRQTPATSGRQGCRTSCSSRAHSHRALERGPGCFPEGVGSKSALLLRKS